MRLLIIMYRVLDDIEVSLLILFDIIMSMCAYICICVYMHVFLSVDLFNEK